MADSWTPSQNIFIIDWRYKYEYEGGHIAGSRNMTSPQQIYSEFFRSEKQIESHMAKDSMIILHCEFSSYRAPMTYNLIRKTDRKLNEGKYPMIWYPELYLLENGYKEFYENYPVGKSLLHKTMTSPMKASMPTKSYFKACTIPIFMVFACNLVF